MAWGSVEKAREYHIRWRRENLAKDVVFGEYPKGQQTRGLTARVY
jgi:hypothetical protein